MTSLVVLALAMLPLAQAIPPPDAQLSVVRVWDISWRDAFDAEGRVQRIPVLAPGGDVTRPAGRVRLSREHGTRDLQARLRARVPGKLEAPLEHTGP